MAIKFDLSSIPEEAVITEATLSLYAYDKNNGTQYLNNGPKKLYQFTDSWVENSIKWSGAPNISNTALATNSNSSTKVWEDFDVTEYVKGVVEDGDNDYGFQLRHSSSSYGVKYRSSEYSDLEYRPKLTIIYEGINIDNEPPEVAVTALNGGEIVKEGSAVDITWDADDNVGVVSSAVYYCIDNWSPWKLIEEISGNPGTLSWTVPNTASKTCKIRVEATDAVGNVGLDESDQTFTIDPMTGINQNITNITPNKPYRVTVTNIQGREIASFSTNNIHTSNLQKLLPSGVHIVHILTPGKKQVMKYSIMR